jgi:hypothetical protein
MRTIFRYVIPVDDEWHSVKMTGLPVHIANGRTPDEVEFWAAHDDSQPSTESRFRVFGTGHPLPDRAVYVGTAPRTQEGLVWHLYLLTY